MSADTGLRSVCLAVPSLTKVLALHDFKQQISIFMITAKYIPRVDVYLPFSLADFFFSFYKVAVGFGRILFSLKFLDRDSPGLL